MSEDRDHWAEAEVNAANRIARACDEYQKAAHRGAMESPISALWIAQVIHEEFAEVRRMSDRVTAEDMRGAGMIEDMSELDKKAACKQAHDSVSYRCEPPRGWEATLKAKLEERAQLNLAVVEALRFVKIASTKVASRASVYPMSTSAALSELVRELDATIDRIEP